MILPPLADLRAQLAAVINTSQHGGPPPVGPPHSHPHGGYNDVHAHHQHQQSSSASPHDHNIDPAIGGGIGRGGPGDINMSTGGDSGGDDSLGDGRKGGKRELSQSKRAAQNRAAQVRRRDVLFRFISQSLSTNEHAGADRICTSQIAIIESVINCEVAEPR